MSKSDQKTPQNLQKERLKKCVKMTFLRVGNALVWQDKGASSHVMLSVHNNWGDPTYTCLYSFKVHGRLPS